MRAPDTTPAAQPQKRATSEFPCHNTFNHSLAVPRPHHQHSVHALLYAAAACVPVRDPRPDIRRYDLPRVPLQPQRLGLHLLLVGLLLQSTPPQLEEEVDLGHHRRLPSEQRPRYVIGRCPPSAALPPVPPSPCVRTLSCRSVHSLSSRRLRPSHGPLIPRCPVRDMSARLSDVD